MSLRLAVLASGKGSNLRRIAEACRAGEIPAEICLVFINSAEAGALRIAEEFGIPSLTLYSEDFDGRESYDQAVGDAIEATAADLLVFAGYMRLVSDGFIDRFKNRMINVHPSLLPAFKGAHAVRDALSYGVKVAGATVHFVTEEMDGGPIISQESVDVREDDDEETLHRRIQDVEHKIYPGAIRMYAEGRLTIEGRTVRVREQ